MLGKGLLTVLRRQNLRMTQPAFYIPKRTWAQVGHVISTPPRVKVSKIEQVLHIIFMYFIWFSPCAYFMSQIKVWRRWYIQ